MRSRSHPLQTNGDVSSLAHLRGRKSAHASKQRWQLRQSFLMPHGTAHTPLRVHPSKWAQRAFEALAPLSLSMRLFFTSRATVDSGRPILSDIWAIVHPLRRHDSIVCLSSSVMCLAMMCIPFRSPLLAPASRVGHSPAVRLPEAGGRGESIQDAAWHEE